MYKLIISASALIVALAGSAQQFQYTLSTEQSEIFYAVENSSDGGYLIGGSSNGVGQGGNDAILVKTNAFGEEVWIRSIGAQGNESIASIASNAAGQIVFGGNTNSLSSASDIMYGSISPTGNIQWIRYIDLPDHQTLDQIQFCENGDLLLTGTTRSFSDDHDVFITRCTSEGQVIWSKAFGTSQYEAVRKVVENDEGGFYIWGHRTGDDTAAFDAYLLKIDVNGEILWTKNYGMPENELAWDMVIHESGDLLVSGDSNSAGAGLNDTYVARISPNGDIIWANTFGSTGNEHGTSINFVKNDLFIVGGATSSFGAGGLDYMAMFINDSGDIKYATAFGGDNKDVSHGAVVTDDFGLMMIGETRSFGNGMYSGLGVKINQDGTCVCNNAFSGEFEKSDFDLITSEAPFVEMGSGASSEITDAFTIGNGLMSLDILCTNQISEEGMSRPGRLNDIGKELEETVKLYPNPSNGPVHAAFKSNIEGNTRLEIYNLEGRLVYQELLGNSSHQRELTISGLSTGIYLVRITEGDKIETKKLVIK